MSSPYGLFKREISLLTEIQNQTDRGAAIVAAAWVEEELTSALKSSLCSNKKSWDRLFGGMGPLGTFSAKIDLASLLGIMDDDVRSDLHTIRDIRNEFAHSVVSKSDEVLSFETLHIKDKCMSLRSAAYEQPERPRLAYLRSCAVLISDFGIYSTLANAPEAIHQLHIRQAM